MLALFFAEGEGFSEDFGHEDGLAEGGAVADELAEVQLGVVDGGEACVLDGGGGLVGVGGFGWGGRSRELRFWGGRPCGGFLGEGWNGAAVDAGARGWGGAGWEDGAAEAAGLFEGHGDGALLILLGGDDTRGGALGREGGLAEGGAGGLWDGILGGACGGGAAALLLAGEVFDGDFSGEDVAGELAGVFGDFGHGGLLSEMEDEGKYSEGLGEGHVILEGGGVIARGPHRLWAVGVGGGVGRA